MEMMIVPPPVKKGDRIGIVAPAGPVSAHLLHQGIALLSSWGLVPVVHQQVYSKQGYLAGSDNERAEALVEVFDDPTLAAVVCAEGGYGCTRLLELLHSDKLGAHNLSLKRFFGFSDITALHCLMRVAVPGYVSFHTPMPATPFLADGTRESKKALHQALFAPRLQAACPPLKIGRAKLTSGIVRGRLIGGNMTLITSLLGTPWQENLHNCVLLLEDDFFDNSYTHSLAAEVGCSLSLPRMLDTSLARHVNEVAYQLDRMFTHLVSASRSQQMLQNLAAVVLGDFGDALETLYEDAHEQTCGRSKEEVEKWFWLEQLRLPPDLPVLSGLPIGHMKDNRAAALGAFVNVDLNLCELRVASTCKEAVDLPLKHLVGMCAC